MKLDPNFLLLNDDVLFITPEKTTSQPRKNHFTTPRKTTSQPPVFHNWSTINVISLYRVSCAPLKSINSVEELRKTTSSSVHVWEAKIIASDSRLDQGRQFTASKNKNHSHNVFSSRTFRQTRQLCILIRQDTSMPLQVSVLWAAI